MEDKKGGSDIVGSEILIYQTDDGHTKIDVKFEDELEENVVVRKFRTTAVGGTAITDVGNNKLE